MPEFLKAKIPCVRTFYLLLGLQFMDVSVNFKFVKCFCSLVAHSCVAKQLLRWWATSIFSNFSFVVGCFHFFLHNCSSVGVLDVGIVWDVWLLVSVVCSRHEIHGWQRALVTKVHKSFCFSLLTKWTSIFSHPVVRKLSGKQQHFKIKLSWISHESRMAPINAPCSVSTSSHLYAWKVN